MIYIQPHSGLANRMRALVSAFHLGEKTNQKITVLWIKDKNLNCNYFDLFQDFSSFSVRDISRFQKLYYYILSKKKLLTIARKCLNIRAYFTDEEVIQKNWKENLEYLTNNYKDNSFFVSCHEFDYQQSYLKYLQPKDDLRTVINENIRKLPENIFGIHIRATDNLQAKKHSPIILFETLLKKLISEDTSINFYLATDDKAIETHFKNLFQGRIYIYPKEFSRNSKKGIQDALIELHLLGSTRKIFGSFYSSYSQMASRIGNIEHEIVKY